jgi:tRNA U34 5-methylaminomethyl-2-thiouridine-forming methyltransferase MnmC
MRPPRAQLSDDRREDRSPAFKALRIVVLLAPFRGRMLSVKAGASYKLVRLPNGSHSVQSLVHGETMHPGLGPQAEAAALYVEQLRLLDRLQDTRTEFVVWDVGLGAGANALTVLRSTRQSAAPIRMISFDQTLDPFHFAFKERGHLGYFEGYEQVIERLESDSEMEFMNGDQPAFWQWLVADFPDFLRSAAAQKLPKPHAILFDPWSPAKNPAMWTAPLFADVFSLLEPARPCTLATYSRSTMLRVSLLLAGFHVGAGSATGMKEETTIAANAPGLLCRPLNVRWLERACRSGSAEPMWQPAYHQKPLSNETQQRLRAHPQFQ